MKFCLFIFTVTLSSNASPKTTEPSLNILDRIKMLKFQINDQIKENSPVLFGRIAPQSDSNVKLKNNDYDYIELRSVTPIMDYDERRKDHKYKLQQLKTTTTTAATASRKRIVSKKNKLINESPAKSELNRPKELREDKKEDVKGTYTETHMVGKVDQFQPKEVFYRRLKAGGITIEEKNKPLPWVHCQDIITPFLSGAKSELTEPTFLPPDHRTVHRFVQLVSLNVTGYSHEEIYSVLYQISNIQLRFFSWDINSLKVLFNALSPDGTKHHTWKTLVHGMKRLFKSWHLDYHNTTNLLKQSMIFRPPCMDLPKYEGSTQSSKVSKYYPSTKPTTPCKNDDDGIT